MNDPHPRCFPLLPCGAEALAAAAQILVRGVFQLPILPERMLTINGGAIVRRM
jgi:hypothetical protein